MTEPRLAEQARDPGRTTAMVPCSWLEMCWGLCPGGMGQPGWGWLLPSALSSVRPWAGHPPALSLASTHVTWSSGVPAWHGPCAWHTAGLEAASLLPRAARGEEGVGSGFLSLTMSGARGSGRLPPGEILATGDVPYPTGLSVGGEAEGRLAGRCSEGPAQRTGLPGPGAPASRPPPPPSSPSSPWTRTCVVVLRLLTASQWLLSDGLPGAQGGGQQG